MKPLLSILTVIIPLFTLSSSYGFSSLPDMKLYGRVMDQNDQPVTGVYVLYEGTNTYLAEGGGRGHVKTDDEGYFVIKTSGSVLSLWGVRDSGFTMGYSKSGNHNLPISSSGMFPDWEKHNQKDRPYVLSVWRYTDYEGATRNVADVVLNREGGPKSINLLDAKPAYSVKNGTGQHGFTLSCTRKAMTDVKDYGDWTFTITANDGGIQEAKDPYLNKAPVGGYQSSFEINMKLNATDYQSRMKKRYYFKTKNSSIYGSMWISIEPHWRYRENRCKANIEFKLNPTGSGNLELKQ